MLILSRKPGERVRLTMPDGTEVWVEVVEVQHHGKVRLGITADKSVVIMREELIERGTDDAVTKENRP